TIIPQLMQVLVSNQLRPIISTNLSIPNTDHSSLGVGSFTISKNDALHRHLAKNRRNVVPPNLRSSLCLFKKSGETLLTQLRFLIAPCSAAENLCRKAPRNEITSKAGRVSQLVETSIHFIPNKRGRLFSRIFSQTCPGAITLALSTM